MKTCLYCAEAVEDIAKECGACRKQLPEVSTIKKAAFIILGIWALFAIAYAMIKMFMAFE